MWMTDFPTTQRLARGMVAHRAPGPYRPPQVSTKEPEVANARCLHVHAAMRVRSPAGHLRESLPFLVGPATLIRPLVPAALRHRIWRHRTLRACPELSAPRLDQLRAHILATVDEGRLRRLQRVHADGTQDLVELCDYERKLEIAVMNTMLAGLRGRTPLRILDIGCGGGYFVAAARYLGHACDGTEVPARFLSPTIAAAYADVSARCGSRRCASSGSSRTRRSRFRRRTT